MAESIAWSDFRVSEVQRILMGVDVAVREQHDNMTVEYTHRTVPASPFSSILKDRKIVDYEPGSIVGIDASKLSSNRPKILPYTPGDIFNPNIILPDVTDDLLEDAIVGFDPRRGWIDPPHVREERRAVEWFNPAQPLRPSDLVFPERLIRQSSSLSIWLKSDYTAPYQGEEEERGIVQELNPLHPESILNSFPPLFFNDIVMTGEEVKKIILSHIPPSSPTIWLKSEEMMNATDEEVFKFYRTGFFDGRVMDSKYTAYSHLPHFLVNLRGGFCIIDNPHEIESIKFEAITEGWDDKKHIIPRYYRIHRNEDGRVHCETGPAIEFTDRPSIYALNGIRMEKEIVLTPADKIDPHILLKEKNVEVRREIIKKIGIERVVETLAKRVVEKYTHHYDNVSLEYELVDLDLGDIEPLVNKIGRNPETGNMMAITTHRPYLKMKNPSTGDWHVEGIPIQIHTVREALKWRNGGHIPDTIT